MGPSTGLLRGHFARAIDMAEEENADNNEDSNGIAASEHDEALCMIAELERLVAER